jgi:hypothetical protein
VVAIDRFDCIKLLVGFFSPAFLSGGAGLCKLDEVSGARDGHRASGDHQTLKALHGHGLALLSQALKYVLQ